MDTSTEAPSNATPENQVLENVTEVQWHFAIPVYTKIVAGFSDHKQALLAFLNSLADESASVFPLSGNDWHSGNNLHLAQHESIQWLTREIGIMANDCISSRHPQWGEFDILMDACWANILGPHGWQPPHNHYPSQWSGVFYPGVEGSIHPSDKNDKSGKIDFFNPIPISAGFGLPTSVTYTPRDGLLLLFPALLQHMVHPNTVGGKRYSIGFNLNVIPKHMSRQ